MPKVRSEANVFPHVSSSVDGFSHSSGCTQHYVPGTTLSTGQVLPGHSMASLSFLPESLLALKMPVLSIDLIPLPVPNTE